MQNNTTWHTLFEPPGLKPGLYNNPHQRYLLVYFEFGQLERVLRSET